MTEQAATYTPYSTLCCSDPTDAASLRSLFGDDFAVEKMEAAWLKQYTRMKMMVEGPVFARRGHWRHFCTLHKDVVPRRSHQQRIAGYDAVQKYLASPTLTVEELSYHSCKNEDGVFWFAVKGIVFDLVETGVPGRDMYLKNCLVPVHAGFDRTRYFAEQLPVDEDFSGGGSSRFSAAQEEHIDSLLTELCQLYPIVGALKPPVGSTADVNNCWFDAKQRYISAIEEHQVATGQIEAEDAVRPATTTRA